MADIVIPLQIHYRINGKTFTRPCSGGVIDRIAIVTAAHCLDFTLPAEHASCEYSCDPHKLSVVSPADVRGILSGKILEFSRVQIHEDYSPDYSGNGSLRLYGVWNDIAILYFNEELPEDAAVAGLPERDWKLVDGKEFIFIGFGQTYPGGKDFKKRYIKMEAYGLIFSAIIEVASGLCKGDSGGVLIAELDGERYIAIASASYVYKECDGEGHLTKLSEYSDWIRGEVNAEKKRRAVTAAGQ